MHVMMNLVDAIKNEGLTLSRILRYQQQYHEYRRWSVFDILKRHEKHEIAPRDKAALWHVARGEMTTMPGGIGLAATALRYAKEIESENRVGAIVLHAIGAWVSRYWLEEEAHHEVAYNAILDEMCGDEVPEDEVIEHRGLFPTDNFLRNMMLQACVEVEVAVTYKEQARLTDDPLIREVYGQILRDEIQHRQYFVSFSQALIDAGVYPAKDALAMAFTWIRPKGGELFGSNRDAQSERQGYVNWWETVRSDDPNDPNAVDLAQHYTPRLFELKSRSVLKAVSDATRQRYTTFDELKAGYFKSLTRPDAVNPVLNGKAPRPQVALV
ncbi:MAG: ferritin-like domain-containing protein [Kofleriaceae bacterium]